MITQISCPENSLWLTCLSKTLCWSAYNTVQRTKRDHQVPSRSVKAVREEKALLTNSTPITPAPMTTIFSGTFFNDKAPVDDTIVSSSIYKKIYTIKIIWKNLLIYKLTSQKILRLLFWSIYDFYPYTQFYQIPLKMLTSSFGISKQNSFNFIMNSNPS